MNIDYKLIGKRIKELRNTKKLTQEQLSEQVSVTVGYISQIERGFTKVNLETLSKIAAVLDCDISYIVTGINKSNPNYLNNELYQKIDDLNAKQKQLLCDIIEAIKNNY